MNRNPLAWHLLAEERIRAAEADGAFENLPGLGQPIPGIDEPHDELWWVKAKLKREQLQSLPPALQLRLDVEQTLARIAELAEFASSALLSLGGPRSMSSRFVRMTS